MSLSPLTRILVADDDPDIRIIITSVISVLGVNPQVVADGTEAVKAVQTLLPDLVVLDYMMPGLTGIEVCQKIRAMPGGEYVAVLMLTARDTVRDKVTAFDEGVDDYLTKPFHYEELQARIRALLRVRELTLRLRDKNEELRKMQEKLVQQERQLVVGELAGTAAHQLGQPLSAILLNCFLLETLDPADGKFKSAIQAVKSDAKRMAQMIEQLKSVDASQKEQYHADTSILSLSEK